MRRFLPLLSLACLCLACPSEEDPSENNSSSSETEGDGDGDGDPSTTGDGDGDPSTSGDGDGDPSTSGDGDPSTSGDGDGDPSTSGDGDGDPATDGGACDPAALVGAGIGADGWGVGDACDLVSTCTDAMTAATLVDQLGADCFGPGPESPCQEEPNTAWCIFSDGGEVDEATFEQVCAALELGVETVECLVLGP